MKIQTNDFVKECGGSSIWGRGKKAQSERAATGLGRSGWSSSRRLTKEEAACRCSSCSSAGQHRAVQWERAGKCCAAGALGTQGLRDSGRQARAGAVDVSAHAFLATGQPDRGASTRSSSGRRSGGKMAALYQISRKHDRLPEGEIVREARIAFMYVCWVW